MDGYGYWVKGWILGKWVEIVRKYKNIEYGRGELEKYCGCVCCEYYLASVWVCACIIIYGYWIMRWEVGSIMVYDIIF